MNRVIYKSISICLCGICCSLRPWHRVMKMCLRCYIKHYIGILRGSLCIFYRLYYVGYIYIHTYTHYAYIYYILHRALEQHRKRWRGVSNLLVPRSSLKFSMENTCLCRITTIFLVATYLVRFKYWTDPKLQILTPNVCSLCPLIYFFFIIFSFFFRDNTVNTQVSSVLFFLKGGCYLAVTHPLGNFCCGKQQTQNQREYSRGSQGCRLLSDSCTDAHCCRAENRILQTKVLWEATENR